MATGGHLKALVKMVDMDEAMEHDVIAIATNVFLESYIEKEMASEIAREMDKKYSPTWHCFVGTNFGSHVVHEVKHFIYFMLGDLSFQVFRSG